MTLARSIVSATSAVAMFSSAACSAEPTAMSPPRIAVAMSGCTRESAAVYPFVRPRRERKHADRTAAIDQALKGQRADVLFFGDSILQRWPEAELQRAVPGRKLIDLGMGGERVADMLYRLRTAVSPGSREAGSPEPGLTAFAAQSPKLVVVLIGTNDLRAKTPCYIAEGTVEIASELRALYPKSRLVVLGILPRGNPQGQYAQQIAEINAAVAETAKRSGQFETADITVTYTCRNAQPCDVAIPRNYVHPSEKGYRLLSTALRDYLTRAR